MRAKSLETYSPTGGIIAVESLAGRELATYVQELNEGVEGFSPTRPRLHQPGRARAAPARARARARRDGAQPHRGRRRSSRTTTASTVTLRDLDSGDERDGPRALRRRRGRQPQPDARHGWASACAGHGELSRSITIYFRADCAELLRDRNQGVIYVHNPELRGFFRIDRSGGNGFLVINTVGDDVTQDSAIDVQSGLTEERALELPAHGDRDRHADGDRRRRQLAGRGERAPSGFATGRVFLAGDAAHVVPAQRRLRRQHGHPGRAQPRVEAGRGRQGRGRAGAARHLRGRAPARSAS